MARPKVEISLDPEMLPGEESRHCKIDELPDMAKCNFQEEVDAMKDRDLPPKKILNLRIYSWINKAPSERVKSLSKEVMPSPILID